MVEREPNVKSSISPEQSPTAPLDFRPFEQPYRDTPFPLLARFRQEQPIFFSPAFNMWVVTRYDDILSILKDHQRFSNHQAFSAHSNLTPEVSGLLQHTFFGSESVSLVMTDPPTHTRLRRLLSGAFSARNVAQLEPDICELTERLLKTFPARGPIDFVPSFAHLLPVQVICRLIGIPDSDHEQLRQWGDDFTELLNQSLPPDRQRACAYSCLALYDYMGELLDKRKRAPQDDLATALLRISEQEEDTLNHDELVELLMALLVAGFETTIHFLSACLLLLLSETSLWENLDHAPQYLERLIEEGLRLATPAMGMLRKTTSETQIGGVTLPANALIYIMLASANRDGHQFAEPDWFNPQRENTTRHLAFGYGIHFCVGAPLARLEGQVAIKMLHQYFPRLHLVENQSITYKPGLILRGLERLLITWD